MRSHKILFTSVGRRIELIQAFRTAASERKTQLIIYGADITKTAPALAFCDRIRIVRKIREEGYIEELVGICEKDQIELLIPTIDTDLLLLSENRELFEKVGTRVMISVPDKIAICRDKGLTADFFIKCGCKSPVPVRDWKEYKGTYPAFIKPKDGSSSINAFRAENASELETYAAQVPDYIVQPYVSGTEYTVDIFCDFNGKPVYITPRIRQQVRAGEVLKTRLVEDPVIVEECDRIVKEFRPIGPITVQLIRDEKTGDDYYIEINPRFGGGAPLSMKAGANSASSLLALLDGEEPEIQSVEEGAEFSRFDQSVRVTDGYDRRNVRGIIFDLDDTLYPERDYVRSGFRKVAEALGDPKYGEELYASFENGEPAIDKLLEKLGRTGEKDEMLRVYRLHNPEITLYDGVEDMLKALRKQGFQLGIITDGDDERQRNKIRALGLEGLVDDIIVTDALGGLALRKPCDIAFRIMAARWALPYEKIVYVGDNAGKDFLAPRQLGMKSVYMKNQEGIYQSDEETTADACVHTIPELSELLMG